MKQLHLARVHRPAGAEFMPFAGWEMPLRFTSIADEHLVVRNAVGLFDVSHMGEILVRGEGAAEFLQRMTTNDVLKLGILRAQYSTVLNERGGIKDDVFVYRVGEREYMVVTNAVNAEKMHGWFKQHAKGVDVVDATQTTVMLALQGPKAQEVLQKLTDSELSNLKRFDAGFAEVAGVRLLLSRSGYTGEDGFELYLFDEPKADSKRAEGLWNSLMRAGEGEGIRACGLGARDSLRLEAGLVLYGNELSEEITPLEAGISFVVNFEKGDFIGREALLEQKAVGVRKTRVGIRMLERGIPRGGYRIVVDGKRVGEVTSGMLSPLLNVGIAMGYVSPDIKVGGEVGIEIHGRPRRARVVGMPFYDPSEYGFRRAKGA